MSKLFSLSVRIATLPQARTTSHFSAHRMSGSALRYVICVRTYAVEHPRDLGPLGEDASGGAEVLVSASPAGRRFHLA